MKTFENYKELAKSDDKLAKELVGEFGKGEWQDDSIYLHNNKESFAEYELTEGWYAGTGFGDTDYNGAPNPMDFIDMKAFGEGLSSSWDEGCHFLSSDDRVVQTSHGW